MKKDISNLKDLKTEQEYKDACLKMWWYMAHQKDGYSEEDYFKDTSSFNTPMNRSYSCHWFLKKQEKFCDCECCKLFQYSYKNENAWNCGNAYSNWGWHRNYKAEDAMAYYEFIKNAWII